MSSYAGLVHGVIEDDSDERSLKSRVAGINFTHQWLPPEERKRMCDFLDLQRKQLAEEFFRIRGKTPKPAVLLPEPEPVAA
jgi:hypothetical protein